MSHEIIIFEKLECKNINCKIQKVKTPDLIKDLILKFYENEKSINESKLSKIKINELIEIYKKIYEDKKYLKNIINYLNEVNLKCRKEYNKYVKELVIIYNIYCYNVNSHEIYIELKKIIKYIIKNIEIDNDIITIENKRIDILKKMEYIYTYGTKFTLSSIFIFELDEKYNKIIKKLLIMFDSKKYFQILKDYKYLSNKTINYLYKLVNEYIDIYSNLIKNILKDKKYINSYINHYRSLDEINKKKYIETLKYINPSYFKVSSKNNKIGIDRTIKKLCNLLKKYN